MNNKTVLEKFSGAVFFQLHFQLQKHAMNLVNNLAYLHEHGIKLLKYSLLPSRTSS